jgi:REP element-mobilizing transposase RayT
MKELRQPAQSRLGVHFLLLFSANGKSVFGGDDDRRKLNDIVGEIVAELQVRVHAYCWLSNEIELIAETGAVSPERLIRKIAVAYSEAVGGRFGRNGTLFSDSHICHEPATQSELVDIVRSMHVRPVVLDIAEEGLSYPWSSGRAYGGLEEIPWLTKATLGPLLRPSAKGRTQVDATEESNAQTAPRMIADAVEAKLSREMVDRSRVWMARALIAWLATQGGIATVAAAAARLRVDATSLEYSMRKYRELAPDLFETPLPEVMNWRCFEVASPKARKHIATILSTLSGWPQQAGMPRVE